MAEAMNERRLPPRVFAQASPRSVGGESLFEAASAAAVDNPFAYASDPEVVERATRGLLDAGFEVLQVSQAIINIAGSPELYEERFSTRLVTEERDVIKPFSRQDTATFIDTVDTDRPGLVDTSRSRLGDVVEGIAIEEPVTTTSEQPWPPLRAYWHLDMPAGVSLGLHADRAHRAGLTGRGVRLAMVDTGWYGHAFFRERGYRGSVVLGPGAGRPFEDRNGHGTGESANVFAVAPDVQFTMVKMDLRNAIGAFNAAAMLTPAPHIISCSWSADFRTEPLSAAAQALAVAVSLAVADGIVVVFSAGNGHFGFPAQHPDVIAAGGVFMEPDGSLRASDNASGFESQIYPGRNVPDISGVVGMAPLGAYIMLPVQPSSRTDAELAGGQHPDADETAPDDGWAAFSGTSAAAPQIAGACALLKQRNPALGPADVRRLLVRGARDVTSGANHPRMGPQQAAPGYDLATGPGLIDVWKMLAPGEQSDLLFYDAAAGRGELYAVDARGTLTAIAAGRDWHRGWTHIVAGDFGGGEQSDRAPGGV